MIVKITKPKKYNNKNEDDIDNRNNGKGNVIANGVIVMCIFFISYDSNDDKKDNVDHRNNSTDNDNNDDSGRIFVIGITKWKWK